MEAVSKITDERWGQLLEALQAGNSSLKSPSFEAVQQFELPTRKEEDWKYTQPNFLKNATWDFNKDQDINTFINTWQVSHGDLVVFENGEWNESLSSIQSNIEIKDENGALDWRSEKEVFSVLNQSVANGKTLSIPSKTVIEKPIFIVAFGNGNLPSVTHFGIELGKFAQASVVVLSGSESDHFSNSFSHMHLEEGANLKVEKIQVYPNGKEIASDNIYLAKDTHFNINTLTLDGQWVRNNLNIHIKGENVYAGLNGIYLLDGSQHVDNHTMVDHSVPHCDSSEMYKGIAADKATAIFNGKVFVRPDAQKTNAFQQNANILMSADATVNSKPELEIYADDVKCSHGSTTGQFDEEAVFYLRSRGIGEKTARELLVQAFAGDVFNEITLDEVRTLTENYFSKKFGWN